VPRYSDASILAELAACADRLGRSPTMREFAADPGVAMHPHTVVARFGTWNAAKRRAGLVPRRFATDEELLGQLRRLGAELGRTPTGPDLDRRRERLPSASLYWQRFGSLSNALRAAGFDVPGRAERRERALADGERLARRLDRPPTLADWRRARGGPEPPLLSEWQVYRLFGEDGAGWSAFRGGVEKRLAESG
jgi:Homing endonuclease associated repeat